MKTYRLNGKLVAQMDYDEFMGFLKGKRIWHRDVYWIKKWIVPIKKARPYVPSSGFILSRSIALKPSVCYGKGCYEKVTTEGKYYFKYPCWTAAYNERNKRFLVIAKNKGAEEGLLKYDIMKKKAHRLRR